MALTYSRFFKVKHRDFVKKGVYNAFLDQDSLLHIDPLLLKGSEIPEFKNAYTEFFNYFRLFIPLVKASKADNLQDRFFNQMVKDLLSRKSQIQDWDFQKVIQEEGVSVALFPYNLPIVHTP